MRSHNKSEYIIRNQDGWLASPSHGIIAWHRRVTTAKYYFSKLSSTIRTYLSITHVDRTQLHHNCKKKKMLNPNKTVNKRREEIHLWTGWWGGCVCPSPSHPFTDTDHSLCYPPSQARLTHLPSNTTHDK